MSAQPSALTKLCPPKALAALPRPRLFRRLDDGCRLPLVWIAGPAGAGKSTLVASYLERQGRPALWYRLEAGDGDLTTFFYYLGLAARQVMPRSRKALPLLTPEYALGIAAFTRGYFSELGGRLKRLAGGPPLIVLDDFQEVGSRPSFAEVLMAGVAALPAGVGVVVISRHQPPPDFARWLAHGRMAVIGWNELRFTVDETAALLGAQDADRLQARADGWIAGIMLLRQTAGDDPLSGREPPVLSADPESRQALFDYFAAEIMARSDWESRELLLATALLPDFTAAMAARLTGYRNAGTMLEALCRHHYFIEKGRGQAIRYAYHPLFREFLLTVGRQTLAGGTRRRLLCLAGEVLAAAGRPEEAVALFREAGAGRELGALVLEHALTMIRQGRHQILAEWLAALPAAELAAAPWLRYWQGVCRLFVEPPEAMQDFADAFARFDEQGEAAGVFMSLAGIIDAVIHDLSYTYTLDRWIATAADAVARYPFSSEEIEAAFACNFFVALTLRQPAHPELPGWLERACALAMRSRDLMLRLKTFQYAVYYHILVGEIGKAGLFLEKMRQSVPVEGAAPLARVFVELIEAFYCWHAGFNEQALALTQAFLRQSERSGIRIFDHLAAGFAVSACLSREDTGAAAAFLAGMAGVLGTNRRNDITYYHYLSCWHGLARGNHAEALAHGEQALQLAEQTGSVIAECVIRQLLAHVRYELGYGEQALELLAKARQMSGELRNPRVECLCRLSLAWFSFRNSRPGQPAPETLVELKTALRLAREKKYLNFDVWLPAMMADLSLRALEHGVEPHYVRELIRRRELPPPTVSAADWPYPLRIQALGGFAVLRDGRPLDCAGRSQRRSLQLLKALIAFGGQGVRQERIIDALWPDADGDAGHHAFETTLYRLRKLLGPENIIPLRDGRLSLDPRLCFVDVWGVNKCFDCLDEGAEPAGSAPLGKLLTLYRGHFLADEEYEMWAVPLREALRDKFIRHLLRAGAALAESGRWEEALNCYQKGLEIDSLVEEFYRQGMLCLARRGRRAEALSLYRRCEKTLSALIGALPSASLQQLQGKLLAESRR